MSSEKKDIKEKLKLTLNDSQINYIKRILVRAIFQKGVSSYSNKEIEIACPKENRELTESFMGIKNLIETRVFKLRNILVPSEVEMIKLFNTKIKSLPNWSAIYNLLTNLVNVMEFNPSKGLSELQHKSFELLSILSERRFDTILSSEIWSYMRKFNLEKSTDAIFKYEKEFFDAFDILLSPGCKLMAGGSLSDAEIKTFKDSGKPLQYLQCCGDAKINTVSKVYDELCMLLSSSKTLILSGAINSNPPGGPALLHNKPLKNEAKPSKKDDELHKAREMDELSFEEQLAIAMDLSKLESSEKLSKKK